MTLSGISNLKKLVKNNLCNLYPWLSMPISLWLAFQTQQTNGPSNHMTILTEFQLT